MTYTRQDWRDYPSGGTAISAARLNHMEQGIDDAHTLIGSGGGGTTGGGTASDNVSGFWNAKVDFGCAADGVTNDAVALNLGLGNGGYIYLPPGDYLCGQELQVSASIPTYIFGPGRLVSSNDGSIITLSNAAHVLDGISIQGAGASLNSQGAVVAQADRTVVKNTKITGVARFAVNVQASAVRVEGNAIDKTSLGSLVDAPSLAAIFVFGDHVRVIGNHLTDTEWGINYFGTAVAGVVGGLIQGNTVICRAGVPAGTKGIASSYAQHQDTIGNRVFNFTGSSIDQFGGTYTVITGNTCFNGGGDGIFVGGANTKASTVVGNTVRECLIGARVWDHAQQVEVSGNNFSNCGSGVVARGSVNTGEQDLSNIRIENNTITCNTTAGGIGIACKSISGLAVSNNSIVNAAHQGIYVDDVIYAHCVDNQVKFAGSDSTGTWAAIQFTASCTQASINGNFCVGTADLAIRVEGDKYRIVGNRWDNISTGISSTATNTVTSDNVAW